MEKSEYEIQHFDFSAKQISLERRVFLRKTLSDALQDMLGKLPSKNAETRNLLEQQKEEVSHQMQEDMEQHIQAAEALDHKYFSIPDNVLLSTDFEYAKEYTVQAEQRIDNEIEKLKRVFLENTIMIASLKMENGKYACIEKLLQDELKDHEDVRASDKAIDINKMQEMLNCRLNE